MNTNRSHAAASAARRPVISPVPEGAPRPFWSVMVPAYDSGDRLARTLEGVLAQDPGPEQMQIRVIDDASPIADPRPLVHRIGGGRVSVWRQPRNVGAATNFTTCVQQATGHWVHILHSDDLVLPGFYDAYRRRIERQPCVMAASRTFHVDDDETVLGLSPEVPVRDGLLVEPVASIATLHPFNFVSVVVARAAYEAVGGFDPALVHANDWEMWTRLAAHGPVAVVDEPLAQYRHHGDSDTTRLAGSAADVGDIAHAIEIIAERFEDPADGRAFRHDARRRWSGLALEAAGTAAREGRSRSARANARWAVRLDPRPVTLRAGWRTVRR